MGMKGRATGATAASGASGTNGTIGTDGDDSMKTLSEIAVDKRRALECALCLAGGLNDPESHFDARTLDLASTLHPHGVGLLEAVRMAARENGYTGYSNYELNEFFKYAFKSPATLAASGTSTLSLPGVLGNVANKFLAQGFNAVETAWRDIAATRPVPNFKEVTSYSLTGDMTFRKVGKDGEIDHATVGEEGYTNQVDTYARIFSITRTDLINDDLGALTQISRKLGRGAALALNAIFWATYLDNSSFFTSARGNLISGGTSALASTGLGLATTAFRVQTDPDGEPIGSAPRILLVPPELEIAADALMSSMLVAGGTEATPNRNPFHNKYRVVTSSYLSNTLYTGHSDTAWYLLADPADLATVEVAFLNGRDTPEVASAKADFAVLGIDFRGVMDFGVSLMEYRAGVKAAGA